MGWLISIILFIASIATANSELMIAAGLFAISGEIAFKSTKQKGEEK